MLIDVVDEHNRVVGQVERQHVLSKRLNFRTVHVLIVDASGSYILQRLRKDHPRSPGLLGSSAAGYLHSRESYKTAAQRTLLSELGIDVELTSIGCVEMLDEHSTKFMEVFKGHTTQKPTINHDEVADLVLMSPEEIDKDIAEHPEIFTPTFRVVYPLSKQ